MLEKFKLTVVIPIYNTEKYLQDTLYCVKNQTIGFENIQLILINDGSTDDSNLICEKFLEIYKKNISYVDLPVSNGVSHARNIGIKMAEGKFITFWDSDDFWSLGAMEKAVDFLEEHELEVDLVSANIEFFEGLSVKHPSNFELDRDEIIDIRVDYQKIRSAGAAAVVKTSVAKQICFDENQECWEDTKFINSIILRKQKYGMLCDAVYYYRRRYSEDSASQSYKKNKNFYLRDLTRLYEGLCKESINQCGCVIPMIQYLLAYALGYRFIENDTILNEKELSEYYVVLKEVLSHIDDKYVKEITNVDNLVKCRMLAFKHDMDFAEYFEEWQQRVRDVDYLYHRLGRTTANYNALKKWFELKQQNISIIKYFQKNRYKKIAIYGISDLGMYLYQELSRSSVRVSYAIDRRAEKLDLGLKILKIENELPQVDAIVVTAVYFFDQIDDLLRNKVTCPVISIEDILYTIGGESSR